MSEATRTKKEELAEKRREVERARLTKRAEEVAERLEALKTASEADPEDYRALAEYGLALAKTGQHDKAIEALTRATTRAPDEPQITLLYAKTLASVEQFDSAVEAALDVTTSPLAAQTDIAEGFFTAGSVRMKQQQYDEAIKYLRQAVRTDEKNVGALLNLGLIMSQRNQGVEALRLLEKAAQQAPRNPRIQSSYALYLEEIGLTQRAHSAWLRLVDIVPDDPDLRVKVASSFIINEEYAAAKEHLAKAVEVNPYDANAHLLYSQVLLRLGDFGGAREHADAAGDLGANVSGMVAAIEFEQGQARSE